jgi:hypothetical protein
MNPFFRWHQKGHLFSRLRFAAALTLGTTLLVCYSQQPPAIQLRGGGVHGTAFVRDSAGNSLALPDFEVFLQNVLTGEPSEPVKTDLFGRFAFPVQNPGSYELRWKQQAGWQEGVLGKKIVISDGTAYPGSIEIKPQEGQGLLVGQVKRADGSSPWVHDEFFGIDGTAQVVVSDGSGKELAGPVRANVAGEFAIAGLPKVPLEIRATSEAAVAAQAVPVNALSFGGLISHVTLTFSQSLPQILSVTTTVGQKPVHNVDPGATVTVTVDARSSSQNALRFDWKLQKGMGTLHPAGASADWTLPTEPGPYTAYVMVSDGFGGYVTRAVSVLVGLPEGAVAARPAATAEATTANPASPTASLKVILDDVSLNGDIDEKALPMPTPVIPPLLNSTNPFTIQAKTLTGTVVAHEFITANVVTLTGLPPNTDLMLEVLDGSNMNIPNVIFQTAPLSPLPGNVVHTALAGQSDSQAVKLVQYPLPAALSFLNLRTGTTAGGGNEMDAEKYYAAVDPPDAAHNFPNGRRTTLGDWWQTNSFDANGNAPGAIQVAYLNNNDLGSGRDMHFLQHDGKVSAYVTNYVDPPGQFNQNPAYADSASAHDPARRAATVCMEWSPVEPSTQPNIVKFFVYAGNGGGPNAVRQTGVDLDGNGIKFVPNLCLNCHGPGSAIPDAADQGASFREFDLATFKYTGGRNVPNETERRNFKKLNLIVRGPSKNPQPSTSPILSTNAIKDLVNGWYGIDPATFNDLHPDFTGQNTAWNPLGDDAHGWDNHKNLYHTVVAKSCRTCHVAFGSGLDWTNYDGFHGSFEFVFGTTTIRMPHSQITYKNFWSSRNPSETGALRSAGLGPTPTPTP